MKTKKHTKLLVLSILAFILSIPFVQAAEPERLIGINLDYDTKEVIIKIVSSGCTDKSSFKIELENAILTVTRVKVDECKAMEEPISLTYTMKELGIDPNVPFTISNKFIGNYYIARIK